MLILDYFCRVSCYFPTRLPNDTRTKALYPILSTLVRPLANVTRRLGQFTSLILPRQLEDRTAATRQPHSEETLGKILST